VASPLRSTVTSAKKKIANAVSVSSILRMKSSSRPGSPRVRELRPQSPPSTPITPDEEPKPAAPSPVSVSPWSRYMHPAPKTSKTKHVELEMEGVMNLVYDCYEKKVKVR
jgi:hypothetical protein